MGTHCRKISFAIFTNVSKSFGLGHYIRCLALRKKISTYLNLKSIPIIVDENDYLFLKKFNLIEPNVQSYNFIKIDQLNFICSSSAIAITDLLNPPIRFLQELKKIFNKVISINDIDEKIIYSDLIINPTSPFDKDTSSVFKGIQASLVRNEFIIKDDVSSKTRNSKKILICMGGTDPQNYATKVIRELSGSQKEITLISKNKLPGNLQNVIHKQHTFLNVEKFIKLIQSQYLVICSSSSLFMENLFLNKPCIVFKTAENQTKLFNSINREKIIPCFDLTKKDYLNSSLIHTIDNFSFYNDIIELFKKITKGYSFNSFIERIKDA